LTGPGQVDVDPNELWSHGLRSQNRATDYYTTDPGGDGSWPSQRAYADAHRSMAGAGQAFGDRQENRGVAVGAAADGFTGQDFDAAKMLGSLGSLIGPMMQAVAAGLQGAFQGMAQGASAGAQALSGVLTSGGTVLSQAVPKGATMGATTPVAGTPPGVGTGAGAGGGGPALGTTLPPADVAGHSGPPKGGRPVGRDGELQVQPAVGVMPGGGMGGLGAVPRGRPSDSDDRPSAPVKVAVAQPDPDTQPIPIAVQAPVRSV
jgi:hypothetical protein